VDTPIDLEMLIAMTNNSEKPQDYIHQSRDPRIDKLVRGPKTCWSDADLIIRGSLHKRMRYELELGRTTGK